MPELYTLKYQCLLLGFKPVYLAFLYSHFTIDVWKRGCSSRSRKGINSYRMHVADRIDVDIKRFSPIIISHFHGYFMCYIFQHIFRLILHFLFIHVRNYFIDIEGVASTSLHVLIKSNVIHAPCFVLK